MQACVAVTAFTLGVWTRQEIPALFPEPPGSTFYSHGWASRADFGRQAREGARGIEIDIIRSLLIFSFYSRIFERTNFTKYHSF